jgi:hypothetical protein
MAKPKDGDQQGAQNHAEGEHGDKSRSAFVRGLHRKLGDNEESEDAPKNQNDADVYGLPAPGHHRLDEDREQHDEADRNSEANRLRR